MSNTSSTVATCVNAAKCVIVADGIRVIVASATAAPAIAVTRMVSGIRSQHSAPAQSSAVP